MTRTLDARRGKRPRDSADKNPERDAQRVFQKAKLSLPIKIETTAHATLDASSAEVKTYRVRPQSWVQFLLTDCPELLGGSPGDPFSNFECFWELYRMIHPTHEIYQTHAQRLSSVVPLCLHGDEGRALKRSNYMVMSLQSPLGSTPRPSKGKCKCEERLRDRSDLPFGDAPSPALSRKTQKFVDSVWCNFRGHSYLSRFLLYGLAGWQSKSHPEVAEAMYKLLASDLHELFHTGVEVPGRGLVYGAVIGCKGDMDWHKKVMNLTRSWLHAGEKYAGEICHDCLAGNTRWPFEDYSENPLWSQTMFSSRPWNNSNPPFLQSIPFDAAEPPTFEYIIKGDLFHIMKCGCCRDVVGGVLLFLCRKTFFDIEDSSKNLPDRLERAHGNFKLWCAAEHVNPGLRSFTKGLFNVKTMLVRTLEQHQRLGHCTATAMAFVVLETSVEAPYCSEPRRPCRVDESNGPNHRSCTDHPLLDSRTQVVFTSSLRAQIVHYNNALFERLSTPW